MSTLTEGAWVGTLTEAPGPGAPLDVVDADAEAAVALLVAVTAADALGPPAGAVVGWAYAIV
ncbi:MAG: hypothetical protein M3O50_07670 [Myxococcota bacterium]|nr:hypothetical protein [Myxococcota bacterium]